MLFRSARLAECAGHCFFAHVPYGVATLLVALTWTPERIVLGSHISAGELLQAVGTYRDRLQSSPLVSTLSLVGIYANAWLICLLGVSFTVVTRVPRRAGLLLTAAALFAVVGGSTVRIIWAAA